MNNIKRIQQKLVEMDLDGVLIIDEKDQRYAAGFPFTDGAVLVTRDRAALMTDSRYIEAAGSAVPDSVELMLFGRERKLADMLRETVTAWGVEKLGGEEQKLSHGAYLGYEALLGIPLIPAQRLFTELRAAKTPEEIDCMIQAQRIAEKALDDVLGLIRPGITEREIAAELNYRMMKYGAEGISFDTIAVTGKKTSMPHGVPGDEAVAAGDFVTMDFGCLKYGYCSDMTRTVAVGSATDEMRKVYATVLEAQLTGIAAARAGVPGWTIDAAARKVIDDAGYGRYFGHSFGHSVGLDIHEHPLAAPAAQAVMPVGCMVSAEPGIYIPGSFGVRIEDVLLLKEDGCEDITRAPKQLTIL